jgi:hypothetical protein
MVNKNRIKKIIFFNFVLHVFTERLLQASDLQFFPNRADRSQSSQRSPAFTAIEAIYKFSGKDKIHLCLL